MSSKKTIRSSKKQTSKQTSKQFMRSKEWQELRQQALDRDQHQCYLCGSKESLCVHHLRYRKFDKALQDKAWNLVTLCVKCHFRVHKSSANLDLAVKLAAERPEQWEHVISRK